MQFKILFLLMGGLSIATAVTVEEIKNDLMQFLEHGGRNPINSNHELKLLNQSLGSTEEAVVWKACFDGQEVAIKISTNQSYLDHETAAYRAVNAMNDPHIESRGIPKIYYTGLIFEKHPVIVMTLFDETCLARWEKQNKSFNAYTTLEVFLQMAKTLTYVQSRGVIHNDIAPNNIYFRGKEVFLGGFDVAIFNGRWSGHGDTEFASSGYWKREENPGLPYRFMDDLESLVYTIWFIERINYNELPGITIKYNMNNTRFVMEKCEHFENFPRSFEASKFIFHDEMLSSKSCPDYKSIVKHLTAAKAEVTQMTCQTCFEWLGSASSAPSALSATSASSALSAPSFTFGYADEDRPEGNCDPIWFYE